MNSGKSNLKLGEFKLIIDKIFLSPTTNKRIVMSLHNTGAIDANVMPLSHSYSR